ncbi:MAG: DUF4349 domain-containing protein [Candidatus Vogelbacteria bacterium]|nr:DUF4349 domain-containing protein [Candidatus Vogelbacteria bacterium]
MKKHLWFPIILIVVVVVAVLAMTFAQVGLPGNASPFVGKNSGVGGGLVQNFKTASADRAIVAPMSAPVPEGASAETSIPRKITKTGSLSILVDTAETTAQNITAIAESVAGYVSDTYLYEVTPGVKAGAITIRVPADKFDQTLSRIKDLALKVENENINANDVTEQFIDLDARLKNLKAQETQYLDILKKSTKVEDVLSVTNQLNQVRQQIDSSEGQLKYLNSQVYLSTITVNLTAEKEVQIFGLNWRPITIVKQAVRSLLNGLVGYANLIISAVIFLPVVILWVITILLVAWIIWWIVKRFKGGCKSCKVSEVVTKKKTKKPVS